MRSYGRPFDECQSAHAWLALEYPDYFVGHLRRRQDPQLQHGNSVSDSASAQASGLRGWNETPVIVLSARSDSAEKVAALDAGADDYVTKPFAMDEFLARLRAAVRRGAASADSDEPVVETDSFTVDLAAKKVIKNGTEVHLTPTEWGMLEMLVRNRGKLVSREELLKEVWGPSYGKETHYLRVYLAQLRRKLEADPSHPRHLLTEAGMGYRFEQ